MLRIHSKDETRTARLQTAIAAGHLLCMAGLLHVAPQTTGLASLAGLQVAFAAGMVSLSVLAFRTSNAVGLRRVRRSLLPMLCLPARDVGKKHAYLPGFGWRAIDDRLRADVEKVLTVPMVAIAVLVLPLFAAEHFYAERIAASARLTWGLAAASGLVWAAFAMEFVVGCTLAEKRLDYCKRHWLDLAIVLLPLVAFLRAARLARLASIQKSARVYRLRGVAMKLWKAVILFDLIGRVLLRSPEKRAAKLDVRRAELLEELADLDARIETLRAA